MARADQQALAGAPDDTNALANLTVDDEQSGLSLPTAAPRPAIEVGGARPIKVAVTLLASVALAVCGGGATQALAQVAHASARPVAHTGHKRHGHHARKVHGVKRPSNSVASATGASVPPAGRGVSAVTPPIVPASCPNADLAPDGTNLAAIEEATACLVNRERVAHGLVALAENASLHTAAARHTDDMITNGYFGHVSPTGETTLQRVLASGYVPAGAGYELGENIATGATSLASPAQTLSAWLADPPHRANILNPDFRETGLAVAAAVPAAYARDQTGATYTQEFGVICLEPGSCG